VAFVRGDVSGDGAIVISDVIRILGFMFGTEDRVTCLDAADVNDDGIINLADAIILLGYLFANGPAPPPPHPEFGPDPTPDTLRCEW
jgi:hypothetical protein